MSITKEILYEKYVVQQKSIITISKELGVSRQTIWMKLYQFDIPLRPIVRVKADLQNQRFGKLVVLNRIDGGWLCRCDCGKITPPITTHALTKRGIKSCGCSQYTTGPNHSAWQGYEELPLSYFNHLIISAKRRNIEFAITIQDAWNQYITQNKLCAITGLPIAIESSYTKRGNKFTASLDRIDSQLGYSNNNIQWVHKDINRLKSDFSQSDFIRLCKLVASYDAVAHDEDYQI